jgi:hypothetical protein
MKHVSDQSKGAVKKRVYERLGDHPHIIGVVAMSERGIYLECAALGCLRECFKRSRRATL